MAPLAVGVAGASGSGKTAFCLALIERLGREKVAFLPQDAYYHDRSQVSLEERERLNYDEPAAIDVALFAEHLVELRAGCAVARPRYSFETHTRVGVEPVGPAPVILSEGILLFADARVRELFDFRIYLEVAPELRLLRRLTRDVSERGRSVEAVVEQYRATVWPMELRYGAAVREGADLVVPWASFNRAAVDLVADAILWRIGPGPAEDSLFEVKATS